jgi:AcrR family transcriptional regulator
MKNVEYSTDKKILYSAEKLFADKGFAATSTRDIAKSAGVNVSMISYYFGSKEKLFEEIFKVRMKEGQSYTTEILENSELNEWEKLIKIIGNYINRVKTLPEFYSILQSVYNINNSGNEQILSFLRTSKIGYIKIYQRILEEGCESGVFTKKPDLFFLHSVIVGTVFYSQF